MSPRIVANSICRFSYAIVFVIDRLARRGSNSEVKPQSLKSSMLIAPYYSSSLALRSHNSDSWEFDLFSLGTILDFGHLPELSAERTE